MLGRQSLLSGQGQSLQRQPGGQLSEGLRTPGHCISTPPSPGTSGIFHLFSSCFCFYQSYRHAGHKQVVFLQLEFSYHAKQTEYDLSTRTAATSFPHFQYKYAPIKNFLENVLIYISPVLY